jgi:sarcosine oxidase, subunit gamma
MVEPPRASVLDTADPGTTAGVSLRALPATAQFIFRGAAAAIVGAGTGFGVTLPETACRAAENSAKAALWLGPDEFLLLAPADDEPAAEHAILAALRDIPHALVNVGHRNVALEVAGPRAARLLNAGCPLDLDEPAFPVGMCTRAVLAKAQIVLWRRTPDMFYLNVWRSYARYVWDFLVEARARL